MSAAWHSYYQALFGVAAAWNLIMAAMLLLRPQVMLQRLGVVDPAARLMARSFVSSVASWGVGYALIAVNQERFRDFAWLGVMSKTIFFLVYAVAYLKGAARANVLPAAVLDLIFALLFAEFLLRSGSQ